MKPEREDVRTTQKCELTNDKDQLIEARENGAAWAVKAQRDPEKHAWMERLTRISRQKLQSILDGDGDSWSVVERLAFVAMGCKPRAGVANTVFGEHLSADADRDTIGGFLEGVRWGDYVEMARGILSTIFNRRGIDDDEFKEELVHKAVAEVVTDVVAGYQDDVTRNLSARHNAERREVATALWNRLDFEKGMVTREQKKRKKYRNNVDVRSAKWLAKGLRHRDQHYNEYRSNAVRPATWGQLVPLPGKKEVDRGEVEAAPLDLNAARLFIREVIRQKTDGLDEFDRLVAEATNELTYDLVMWLREQEAPRMPNVRIAEHLGVTEGVIRGRLKGIDGWKDADGYRLAERIKQRMVERQRLERFQMDTTRSDDPIFDAKAPRLLGWDEHYELCAKLTVREWDAALAEWAEDALRCELMLDELGDALRS